MTVHIGTERQLFLDDLLIEDFDGVEVVMQRPVKPTAPVLEGTEPWEPGVASIIGNSLHYDEEDRICSRRGTTRREGSPTPRRRTASTGTSRVWGFESTTDRPKTT